MLLEFKGQDTKILKFHATCSKKNEDKGQKLLSDDTHYSNTRRFLEQLFFTEFIRDHTITELATAKTKIL